MRVVSIAANRNLNFINFTICKDGVLKYAFFPCQPSFIKSINGFSKGIGSLFHDIKSSCSTMFPNWFCDLFTFFILAHCSDISSFLPLFQCRLSLILSYRYSTFFLIKLSPVDLVSSICFEVRYSNIPSHYGLWNMV